MSGEQKTVEELLDFFEEQDRGLEASENQPESLILKEESPELKPVVKSKKRLKRDIREDIVAIYEAKGEEYPSLDLTKAELSDMLASLITEGVEASQSGLSVIGLAAPEAEKATALPESKTLQKPVDVSQMGATQLFTFNKLVLSVIQTCSQSSLNKTPFALHNIEEAVDKSKEDLMRLYAEIYRRHAAEINKYLSVTNMVILTNIQIIQQSLIANEKKKL